MEIQKISVQSVVSSGQSLSRLLAQLRPGYSLDAVVASKLAENSFVLKLADGQLLRAQTPNVLELGQILKLEVVKGGVVPELKIIVSDRGASSGQDAVLQALRQFLPRQQSLADFAVSLRQVATFGQSDAVVAAIHDVQSTLLSKDELISVEGLKRGIINSGVFLEAKLANMSMTVQGDLKGYLLVLADALQKTHGDSELISLVAEKKGQGAAKTLPDIFSDAPDKAFLVKTEGAIAKIVVDQLVSLPQNDDKQNFWQIEIPFVDGYHNDSIKLQINREGKKVQSSDCSSWSVSLVFNPPGLGSLHSRISLVGGVIDTYFWSDRQLTTALVREHLKFLSERYEQVGLVVGRLNAIEGMPVHEQHSGALFLSSLLDEQV